MLCLVTAALVGFYLTFDRTAAAPSITLKAIPQSAAMILETNELGEIWRDLSQTNIIWEELRATDLYFRLDVAFHALDSLLVNQKELRGYLADKPAAVSVHVSGARSYSYLLSLQLTKIAEPEEIDRLLPKLFGAGTSVKKRMYDGVAIYTFQPKMLDDPLIYFQYEGLLVISLSSILAEESLRALLRDGSVLSNPSFMDVKETQGHDARAELYINYKQLKNILAQYAGAGSRDAAFFSQPYAEWSALDINLKSNAVVMNGFVLSPDSSDAWLGAFRDSPPVAMELLDYMPSNTAYFAFLGFDDFHKWRQRQLLTLQRSNRRYSLENEIKKYDDACDCDISDLALSWIGSQAVALITEPATDEYAQNQLAIFMAADGDKAEGKLILLHEKLAKGEAQAEAFGAYEIYPLPLGTFYGAALSEAFEGLKDPYFTRVGDAILMANSINALRNLLNGLSTKNTLVNDDGFAALSEQISGSSNLLIYSSLARSPYIYQHLLDEENGKAILAQAEVLKKFEAFIYQVSHYRGDLYYNNIYLKHNPAYKKETNSLWELQVKNTVSQKPSLLTNHYTDALEIFLQDDSNRVYLISNTGKLLWELPLKGKITSDIHQVDVYKNGKLQILFSTATQLYLIDRNGNNVESYPVKFSKPASNGVSVADYDNSRDYRFFIGLAGGEILTYDVKGSIVEGWEYSDPDGDIVSPVKHIRIKSKDYLFARNRAGDIRLLDRKGDLRQKTTQKILAPAKGEPQLALGSKITESSLFYVDSAGYAYRQGFNDRFEKIRLTEKAILDYDFADLDGDGSLDCVVLSATSLQAFKMSGAILFSVDLAESQSYSIQLFLFPKNAVRIGLTDPQAEQLLLYEANGAVRNGFPIYGSTPFAVGDMNSDGYFNLITAGKDGFMYAYAIE